MKENQKNIVWLASYPKSGNTWLRLFLQNILGIDQGQAGIPTLNEIPIASNRMLIDNYLGVDSSDLTAKEIHDYRPDVYRALSAKLSDLQVIKSHDQLGKTSGGEPIFPEEITRHIIYIVRNPLDIAVSYSFHSGKSIDAIICQMNDPKFEISKSKNELKPQISQHLGTWSDHVRSWTEQTLLPITVLKYEEMLDHCEDLFKDILNKIDISIDKLTFERALEATRFNNLKNMEEEYGFTEKPPQAKSFFREGKKNIYRKHLSSKQIDEIMKNHGPVMESLDYIKN